MKSSQLLKIFVTIVLMLMIAGTAGAQRRTKAAAPAAVPDDPSALDINSAPSEKLMTLPGIDLALAKKIIAQRPYRTKNDLVTKKVLPQATYDGISRRITVKQEASAKAAPTKAERPAARKTKRR